MSYPRWRRFYPAEVHGTGGALSRHCDVDTSRPTCCGMVAPLPCCNPGSRPLARVDGHRSPISWLIGLPSDATTAIILSRRHSLPQEFRNGRANSPDKTRLGTMRPALRVCETHVFGVAGVGGVAVGEQNGIESVVRQDHTELRVTVTPN